MQGPSRRTTVALVAVLGVIGSTGSVVKGLDTPGIAANGGTLVGESIPNGRLDSGETVQLQLCVTNLGPSASGNVTGAVQPTGGVLSPSGPQSYGVVAPAGDVCRTHTIVVGPSCGSVLTATLQAQESGGLTRDLTYAFQVGNQSFTLVENFDGVAAPGLPDGWSTSTLSGAANLWVTSVTTPDTAPNRAFIADPPVVSDNVLQTSDIAMPASTSVLTFRNHYNIEIGFDGSVLEISINGGAFTDIIAAGGTWLQGGYNSIVSACCSSPIGGRAAWGGNSGGFLTTSVMLPGSANSQNVRLRWRLGSDNQNVGTGVGWAIDTIALSTYICSGAPPVITTQPQSQTVPTGGSATLTVFAAGSATLTYQWYLGTSGDTSSAVPGATASTYVTPPLVAGTSYWVRVSNAAGFVDSNTATIAMGPGGGTELIANGDFSSALAPSSWVVFEEPDIIYNVDGGVFQFYRANSTTTLSGQATIFQNTGVPLAALTPLRATFDIGNSSSVRKRISVLLIDGDFSDINVCTFWLAPGAPLRTYMMRTHTTKGWSNAAIYFYAATKGQDGGFYQIDNVSLQTLPGGSTSRTDCVDPTSPPPPGGAASPTLLTNGDFSTGSLGPWATFGVIQSQVADGVVEFIRPAPGPATPAGTVFQTTGQAMAADEFMTATFQLGNSSAVRKRATVLLVGDGAFSDLMACTFWLAPGQPLQDYAIRGRATKSWTDTAFYVYAATIGNDTWTRLDNVTLTRTPGTPMLGTECIEPAPPVVGSFSASVGYPISVMDNAVSSVGGNLYVFGGIGLNNILATSYRFDGSQWLPIADLPQPLEYAAAVTDGTNAFILGGSSAASVPQTSLYRYNVAANTYTTLASFTTGTWNHAAVFLNGKIYKFCGHSAGGSTSALQIYDVVSNTWSPAAPYPLAISFVSAWTDGTYIYGAGGVQSVGSVPSLKTYRYDPAANTWNDDAIADLPVTRWGAASAIYNGRVVLAGGHVGGTSTATLSTSSVSWDQASNTWVEGPPLVGERARMNGAVLNGSFHVIGGRSLASPAFAGTNDHQRLSSGSPIADPERRPGGAPKGGSGNDAGPWTIGLLNGSATDMSGTATPNWLRPIDLTDATRAMLVFDSRFSSAGGSGAVQVTSDGVNWESVAEVENENGRVSVDLNRYLGRVVYVRFVSTPAGSMGRPGRWSIGDVAIIVR